MYNDSEIGRMRELVISIYELNGKQVTQNAVNAFLGKVTRECIDKKRLSAGLKLADHLLEYGPTVSDDLTPVIGCSVSQMSFLSPYHLGLVDVVGSRLMPRGEAQKNIPVYGPVEGKDELLRKYVPLMKELVTLVGRKNKNAS